MNELSGLYRESIRRHAADPVGYRHQIAHTHWFEADNPLCGDRILVQLQIADQSIAAAAFDGAACAICMASASLLCTVLPGKRVSEFQTLHDRLRDALESDGDLEEAEELKPLLGVKPYPSRIRCATLPWSAARSAL